MSRFPAPPPAIPPRLRAEGRRASRGRCYAALSARKGGRLSAIRLERTGGLVTARFDKPRGNAIDEPLVKEMAQVAKDLGTDPAVQGVMLASAHPKLFCPGLDLVTLLEYDRPGMQRFMGLFTEMVWALYSLRKPVVAAVGGHAVAGGC